MLLLYRQVKSVKVGQVERFSIVYTPEKTNGNPIPPLLYLKVKNTELLALRAAYLAGPYVLYVDCTPEDYLPGIQCFSTADQPVFEPQLLPGQLLYAELACHSIKEHYRWTVDVVLQTLFNNTIDVDFEISIGTSKQVLRDLSFPERKVLNGLKTGCFASNILAVLAYDTLDLWNLPLPVPEKPKHLVILTHGLLLNVLADMLYVRDRILLFVSDSNVEEDVVVRGYTGNVARTERGVKYLGSRVAEYVLDLVKELGNVTKISFIGHSLGGLVQTFAIAYIENNFPEFFVKIQPENFVAISLPMLGLVHENPKYVKLALLAGIVGKTGQDLGLVSLHNQLPLLVLLPTGPTHRILCRFKRRTIYSNLENDGVVPLRTSSLYFINYKEDTNDTDDQSVKPEVNAGKDKESDSAATQDMDIKENEEQSSLSPFQTMIQFFMPQKQTAPDQTNHLGTESKEGLFSYKLPASTLLLINTAQSLVLPPMPTFKYITDPQSRGDVVIHDKVYCEKDIPPCDDPNVASVISRFELEGTSSQSTLKERILSSFEDISELEEAIARQYHKHMLWRKVLVKLLPDAHNNIIVRRKYANAYGWPVIDHLVQNHFGADDNDPETKQSGSSHTSEEVKELPELTTWLLREYNTKQNSAIEKQVHHWINEKDEEKLLFNLGPTGILLDFPEMVERLKDLWFKQEEKALQKKQEERDSSRVDVEEDDATDGIVARGNGVMGEFI